MSNRVFISLGSNIDKETNLPAAITILKELGRIQAVSSVFETVPIGLPGDPKRPLFWNAAVQIETNLDAADFRSEVLGLVEKTLKRQRSTDRNSARTIDADLILFNQDIFELDETHHIPDPDLLRFAHVAVPLAELAPKLNHPETGELLAELAARLLREMARNNEPVPLRRPEILLGG